MKFRLDIDMAEANMTDADDVAAALLAVAGKVGAVMGEEGDSAVIRGTDGATIGKWKFSDKLGDWPRVGDRNETGDNYDCYDDGYEYHDSDGDVIFRCSLEDGHDGPHVAGGGRYIVAVWESA